MTVPIIRVVLADDHSIVREGLHALLERGGAISVVGEAATGTEAIRLAVQLAPDVVVMDFAMPECTGIEACRAIRARMPQCRVLFLSMHYDPTYFRSALEAGAVGYVVKRSAAAEIYQAVQGTARGESYLAPTLAAVLLHDLAPTTPSPLDALTGREREVLHLVAVGKTSQAIATQLGISVKTVQSHREHIMEKLELRDITHLVRFAMRHGVIAPDP